VLQIAPSQVLAEPSIPSLLSALPSSWQTSEVGDVVGAELVAESVVDKDELEDRVDCELAKVEEIVLERLVDVLGVVEVPGVVVPVVVDGSDTVEVVDAVRVPGVVEVLDVVEASVEAAVVVVMEVVLDVFEETH
jgi:hypothetical protein